MSCARALTRRGRPLRVNDMSVVRARDGDVELLQPGRRISRCSRQLLRAAGIGCQDIGKYEAFIPFRAAIQVIESAAESTATSDFGRLAKRQGIEI